MGGRQLENQELQRVSNKEMRTAMERIKSGNDPYDIPVEYWRNLGERGIIFLT